MTIIQIRVEECNINSSPEAKQCFYVDMPHNLIEVDDRVEDVNIENISNTKKEDKVAN
jgi:hypothetical protein